MGVRDTSSAARMAYRWDTNGSSATRTGSPVVRAVKATTPPSAGGRAWPVTEIPAAAMSGR